MIEWSLAANEEDMERGTRLLCAAAKELGVPYSWETVLNSLIYALDDNGFLVGRDPEGRTVAFLAFTIGTGEDQYKDRSRFEVHLLFVDKGARQGRMMLELIRSLADRLLDLPEGVREIVFYAAPSEANRKLYGKIASLAYTSEQPCGPLDFYTAAPEDWLAYADRLRAAARTG